MAVPSKSVSLDDYDALFDFKDFDSDLIGRYRFAPSIYRLDARATSATSFFRPKNVAEDESSKAAGSDIKSHPFSPTMHCKISKRSPSGPLSSLSSDGGYGSSSAASSPGPKDFSYFPLFDSCAESSDDCTDEEKMRSLRREASWSQYMDPSSGVKAVEVAEHWMVDMSQLFLGQKFASGTYSRLYHGLYKGKEVAVKLLRPPDEDDEVAQRLEREFRQEVSMLSRLHHQNVVQFFAACKQQGVWCIVTEYLSNCSLRSFLNKNGPGSLTIKTILGMALDIGRGMEYLHSQGFIHRDLKSENLCLDKDLCVKITDFGVSCHFTERDNISKDIGTYRWMAPELYSLKPYTKKVDVYSFGIVLWELYTGLTPFQEMSAVQAAFAVVNKHSRPVIPSDCPHVLSELMEQCWCANPNKRPDFWEIVKQLEQYEGSSS